MTHIEFIDDKEIHNRIQETIKNLNKFHKDLLKEYIEDNGE